MNNVVKTATALAACAFLSSAALAQTSTTSAPKKPSIFSKLFHPKPKPGLYQSNGSTMHPMGTHPMMGGHSMMGGSAMGGHSMMGGSAMGGHSMMNNHSGMMGGSMMGGQFIGNKNSHVYHMPGDKGSLPSPQNRVYFSSAAAAQAAGYHVAGGTHSMTSHSTMMHH